MARLLQMAIFQKFSGGHAPDPPSRSHAFGARLHDHSHDAGFATVSSFIRVQFTNHAEEFEVRHGRIIRSCNAHIILYILYIY